MEREKSGVSILMSNKIDFKPKAKRQRRTIHDDKGNNSTGHITLINIYAPNSVAPIYVKQILMDLKGEIKRNTVIVRYFNTPLTSMKRCSRQKINKETVALNGT